MLAALSIVIHYSPDGEMVVIDKAEFLAAMPEKLGVTAAELAEIVKVMSLNELVSVKYIDDEVYCLASLPKGKIAEARELNPKNSQLGEIKVSVDYKRIGVYSFIGALIGGFITGIITVILFWVLSLR